jgi:Tfp pilus assembly protein PilN
MNCSVNLVPVAWHHARTRARRKSHWLVAGGAALLLVGLGWGTHHAASLALGQLADEVEGLTVQRAEAQRRLATLAEQRDGLVERLQTLAEARRPQMWSRRLVELTQNIPDRVFLTTLTLTSLGDPSGGVRRTRLQIPALASGSTNSIAQGEQAVQLLGHALDLPSLIQFLKTLQSLPGWRSVELIRATQQPVRDATAVSFELDCRTSEE